jgi:hypothetical protein
LTRPADDGIVVALAGMTFSFHADALRRIQPAEPLRRRRVDAAAKS